MCRHGGVQRFRKKIISDLTSHINIACCILGTCTFIFNLGFPHICMSLCLSSFLSQMLYTESLILRFLEMPWQTVNLEGAVGPFHKRKLGRSALGIATYCQAVENFSLGHHKTENKSCFDNGGVTM